MMSRSLTLSLFIALLVVTCLGEAKPAGSHQQRGSPTYERRSASYHFLTNKTKRKSKHHHFSEPGVIHLT